MAADTQFRDEYSAVVPEDSAGGASTVGGDASFGARALIVMAALVVAMAGLQVISSVFGPVFFALTLVISLLPINRALIRHRVPVAVAIFISLFLLLTTLLLFAFLLVVSLWGLPDIIGQYQAQMSGMYVDSVNWLKDLAHQFNVPASYLTNLASGFDINRVMNLVTALLSSISSASSALLTMLLAILFLVVDTAVPLKVPANLRGAPQNLAAALREFETAVRQYWIVTTVFGLIVAVLDVVALWWMGIPGAITWGVLAFITNYIPNLGFVIGVIPPALVGLLQGGWKTALWIIVIYSVLNFVIQSLIQPKFTGDAVGLNTSVTFFSLLVWSIIIGPLGAILAVPLTLFFKAILIDSDPRSAWLNLYFQSSSALKKTATRQDEAHQESLLRELGFIWPDRTGIRSEIKERFRPAENRFRGRSGKTSGKIVNRIRPNLGNVSTDAAQAEVLATKTKDNFNSRISTSFADDTDMELHYHPRAATGSMPAVLAEDKSQPQVEVEGCIQPESLTEPQVGQTDNEEQSQLRRNEFGWPLANRRSE